MRIIVMQGTTLAGKSRHGKKLAEDLGYDYIASGEIARSLMDESTKALFAEGKLSPHDSAITQEIYKRILAAHKRGGVVLDGYPRNAKHVIDTITFLESWMHDTASRARVIIVRIDIPASVIIARSTQRVRDQFDTPEIVLKRHSLYLDETAPALDYLGRVYGNVATVSLVAEAEFDSVHSSIVGELADRGML